MRDVRFAVVIPAYNVQNYLPELYTTLLEQTYKNFLVITIDDCSQDDTGAIADEYVETFHKADIEMVVHHKTVNEGLSAARNTGIDIAIYAGGCDYILFLDADDTVSVDLLAVLAEKIRCANSEDTPDMLIYGFSEDYYSPNGELTYSKEIRCDEAHLKRQSSEDKAHLKQREQAAESTSNGLIVKNTPYMVKLAELEASTMLGYAWNKAYKLALFDRYNLLFEAVVHIEDIVFNLAFLEHADSFCVIDEILYHYRNANQTRLTKKHLPNYMRLQKRRVYEFLRLQNHLARDGAELQNYMTRDMLGVSENLRNHVSSAPQCMVDESTELQFYPFDELDIPEKVYEVAAGEYFRSLQSMIVREKSQKKSKKDIIDMVESELVDELYTINGKNLYLLLRGHLPEGKASNYLYKPLARGKINRAYRNACIIEFVQKHFSGLYAKLKQHR